MRFAPSPNGRLHLGHAYSALLNAKIAADLGGICRLRIEDIDPARSKPEFTEAILADPESDDSMLRMARKWQDRRTDAATPNDGP